MRWLPKSIPVLVVSVALYFVLYFGIESVRILSSPLYGLDQADFAYVVHGIGRRMGVGPKGLTQLAVFFGVVKLAIAVLFMIYLGSRVTSGLGHEVEHEIADAAAILIVLVTVVAAMPALFDGATTLLAQFRLPLWLASLVVTLSMIERTVADERGQRYPGAQASEVALPPRRKGVSAQRWDALRRSANVGTV